MFAAVMFLTLLLSSTSATPLRQHVTNSTLAYKRQSGFPYATEKVRGVNLGGWLVLEPWITPYLFDNTGNPDIVDEWSFSSLQTKSQATAALTSHWNSWITEQDFIDIAAAGLNHVRIPIGYWAFDVSGGEPFVQGQYPYLKQAVQWAANHGIWVLIDVHGHPGSQNGFDNSGLRGAVEWFTQTSFVARSNNIVITLAEEFSQPQYGGVVSSIEPMNEPAGFDGSALLSTVKQFYYDSYGNIRYHGNNIAEVIHDAFQDPSYWTGFMPSNSYTNVVLDTHHYQLFTEEDLAMSYQEQLQTACDFGQSLASWSSNSATNLWAIVGEWTTSPTDCAMYLNGRGVGSRYDGSYPGSYQMGDCRPFTGPSYVFPDYFKTFMRQFYEAQTSSYELANGWIYWNWKTQTTDEWSYQAGLAGGWIPYDPTERQYPDVCG